MCKLITIQFLISILCCWCFRNAVAIHQKVTEGDSKDIFSSTYQMQKLLSAELELALLLKQHLKELTQDDNEVITNFLEQNYGANRTFNPTSNLESYVAHPVNSFGIVKRTSANFMEVRKQLQSFIQNNTNAGDKITSRIRELIEMFPNVKDYVDVLNSIVLIQEAYDLNTDDLANGNIVVRDEFNDTEFVVFHSDYKFDYYELYQIGTVACENNWYDICIQWLDLALKNMPDNVPKERRQELEKQHQLAIEFHDKTLDRKGPVSKNHRCNPLPFDKKIRKKKKYREAKKNPGKKVAKIRDVVPLFNYTEGMNVRDNSFFLCKEGESAWRTPDLEQDLTCQVLNHGNPFLKLAPFKMEVKNKAPFVAVFRDFMSAEVVQYFKSVAEDNLSRSSYGGKVTQTASGIFRTSKQTWLHDRSFNMPKSPDEDLIYQGIKDPFDKSGFLMANNIRHIPTLPVNLMDYLNILDPVGFSVSKSISLATGLELLRPFASESYQIANYGIGGQYGAHWDTAGYFLDDIYGADTGPGSAHHKRFHNTRLFYEATGDRLGTFMTYLADVEAGGSTCFPLLGISVKPVKGDAVFWLNQKASGLTNKLTNHAGCPVLVGSKWITNKWIGYRDQFKKFKCGLERVDDFNAEELFVNH